MWRRICINIILYVVNEDGDNLRMRWGNVKEGDYLIGVNFEE